MRHMSLMRALLAALLSSAIVATSGCWDQIEINQLAIIIGLAVDADGVDRVAVSAQVSVPSSSSGSPQASDGGGGRPRYALTQGAGLTPFDALRALTLTLSRAPFLAHLRVVIVSRALAERGLAATLDYLERDPSPRGTVWLTVSEGTAADVLAAQATLGQSSSQSLEDILRGQGTLGEVATVDIAKFVQLLSGDAKATYAPIVKTAPRPGGGQVVRVEGTAIFIGDRLVGTLDEKATRGLLWLRGEIKGSRLAIVDQQGGTLVSMDVTGSSTRLKARFEAGRPRVDVAIMADATLSTYAGTETPDSSETYVRLTRAAEETIRAEVAAALAGAQAARADVFGFADALHRADRHQWRKLADHWPDAFAQMEVKVDVSVRMSRFGLLLKHVAGGK